MTLGVVALGDSIIRGGTRQQFTTPQSWALTLAERADLPFTMYAQGGYTSQRVVDELLPRVRRDGYDVGAVTVGANDLLYGWDRDRFAKNLDQILARLACVADRVVVTNLPARFRVDPGEVNAVIVEQADRHGALVVDVSDMNDRRWLRPDRVHPTAIGLAEIGYRAADVLGYERLPVDLRRLGPGYRLRHVVESAVHTTRAGSGWVRR